MNTTVNTDQSDKEFEENQSMMKEMIDNLQSQLKNNRYSDLDKKKIDFCIKIINYLRIHIRSRSIVPQETRYQKLCRYTRHFKYLEKWHQKLQEVKEKQLQEVKEKQLQEVKEKQLQEVKEKHLSQVDVDKIFIDCIACLVELRLSWEREGTDEDVRSEDVRSLDKEFAWDNNINFMSTKWYETIVEKNSLKLSNDHLSVLKDLFSPAFPIKVINFYLGLPDYQALINHKETITSSENTRKELQEAHKVSQNQITTIQDKIQEVQNLENTINNLETKLKEKIKKELETAFNFVVLDKGFAKLLEDKKAGNAKNLIWLRVLGGAMALIPIIKIGIIYYYNDAAINWTEILAGISLEFVLIYFFRVVLNQYQITKTQIMQLELRRSLCQFIQDYAEYAQKIKAQDATALEKFENIIFSSILSHDANIPGTFDGIGHIISLIRELKGTEPRRSGNSSSTNSG